MRPSALTLFLLTLVLPAAAGAAHIVALTVEDPNNYEAPAFLRGFADAELKALGHRVTLIAGEKPQPTRFDGLTEAMREADLLIVFVRRATPPAAQLEAIRAHLAAGRPLLGIRTANHGFAPQGRDVVLPPGCASWPEFTPDVLGCQNTGYETRGMPYRVTVHPDAPQGSPLLEGVDVSAIRGHQSLYRVLPLAPGAVPLLLGSVAGDAAAQPLAWTRLYGPRQARVFYTSLGAPADVNQPDVRRLLTNAVRWTLAR